jgi:hypothetical protein
MNKRTISLTAPFMALVAWLATGGADQLRQSLGRQYVQWGGIGIGLVSLLGYWGIDHPLLTFNLTQAEFYEGIKVALGFVVVDTIGSLAALWSDHRKKTIPPQFDGAVKG